MLSKIDSYDDSSGIIFYFVLTSITYLITFIGRDQMTCAELTISEQNFYNKISLKLFLKLLTINVQIKRVSIVT